MGYDDERAKLFLPFAAVGGMETLLAIQEDDSEEELKSDCFEFSKKVQKNNTDTC